MAHFGTCTLSVRDRSEDSVQVPILKAAELGERWPVLLWFYLKMLGLYHSGKYDITSNIVHCFYFYRRNGAWGTGGSEPPDPTSHTPVFSPFSVAPTSVSFLLENYIVQCCKKFSPFPLVPTTLAILLHAFSFPASRYNITPDTSPDMYTDT